MRTRLVTWTLVLAICLLSAPIQAARIVPLECETLDGLVGCGQQTLAEGDLLAAEDYFTQALLIDSTDPRAGWGKGFIISAWAVLEVLDQLDLVYIGQVGFSESDAWFKGELRKQLAQAAYIMGALSVDRELDFYQSKILVEDNGSSIGIGAVDWDNGEALLVRGVLQAASGALLVMDGLGLEVPLDLLGLEDFSKYLVNGGLEEDLKSGKGFDRGKISWGLDELISGIDDLVLALDSIMLETDDQTDDLLSRSVIQLKGNFRLPGIIPSVTTAELLTGLGLDPLYLESLTMPQDAVNLLRTVQGVLRLIKRFI